MKNEEILKRKKFIFLMPIHVWKLENNLPTEYLNGKQHSKYQKNDETKIAMENRIILSSQLKKMDFSL